MADDFERRLADFASRLAKLAQRDQKAFELVIEKMNRALDMVEPKTKKQS